MMLLNGEIRPGETISVDLDAEIRKSSFSSSNAAVICMSL